MVSEQSGENPAVPFDLTVGLRVICKSKDVVRAHELANVLKQPRRELRAVFREKHFWWTVSELLVLQNAVVTFALYSFAVLYAAPA